MYEILQNLVGYNGTTSTAITAVMVAMASLFGMFSISFIWEFVNNIITSIIGRR